MPTLIQSSDCRWAGPSMRVSVVMPSFGAGEAPRRSTSSLAVIFWAQRYNVGLSLGGSYGPSSVGNRARGSCPSRC